MAVKQPSWYRDGAVLVSYAPTCGINKDGEELYRVDPLTGQRTEEIDDLLRDDVRALLAGEAPPTARYVEEDEVKGSGFAVPTYYDPTTVEDFEDTVKSRWPSFDTCSLRELVDRRLVQIRGGHGSPSADVRTGDVPYIKVSDLRAGAVNINPTNRVSDVVARRYWRGPSSGLQPFDLISPARTSKNIGEFSVLMPGQERVVLTKEVIVLRPGPAAHFDSFFLAWCMSLRIVRNQWRRIVFMQTNREDTGDRFFDIRVPLPRTSAECDQLAAPFKEYFEGTSRLRERFIEYLSEDDEHHVFLATSTEADEVER